MPLLFVLLLSCAVLAGAEPPVEKHIGFPGDSMTQSGACIGIIGAA